MKACKHKAMREKCTWTEPSANTTICGDLSEHIQRHTRTLNAHCPFVESIMCFAPFFNAQWSQQNDTFHTHTSSSSNCSRSTIL